MTKSVAEYKKDVLDIMTKQDSKESSAQDKNLAAIKSVMNDYRNGGIFSNRHHETEAAAIVRLVEQLELVKKAGSTPNYALCVTEIVHQISAVIRKPDFNNVGDFANICKALSENITLPTADLTKLNAPPKPSKWAELMAGLSAIFSSSSEPKVDAKSGAAHNRTETRAEPLPSEERYRSLSPVPSDSESVQ